MKKELTFTLNGEAIRAEVDPQWTLLYFLREVCEFTGTKEGCGYGECGACTVIIDGKAVNSCLYPVMEAEGRTSPPLKVSLLRMVPSIRCRRPSLITAQFSAVFVHPA